MAVFFSDFRGASEVEKEHMVYNITFDTCISYLKALQITFVLEDFKRLGWVNIDINPAEADTVVAGVVSYRSP